MEAEKAIIVTAGLDRSQNAVVVFKFDTAAIDGANAGRDAM